MKLFARMVASAVIAGARLLTGVRANWQGCTPSSIQRVYFANHTSQGDFVLIWAVLPHGVRQSTRPVAGADYWRNGNLRRFVSARVFQAVLIDRNPVETGSDPVGTMIAAVDDAASLILFPEGTRNLSTERLQPFKSGIYRIALARPALEFVPVWIDNLNRVLPKGEILPIPLLCTVTFGAPVMLRAGEEKADFLSRVRAALLVLAPVDAPR